MPSHSSTIGESTDLTVGRAADHRAAALRERKVLVGFDGFVDNIVTPVATRYGGGSAFTPIETTHEFAELIRKAGDGKNANIELFLRLQKVGGNGPILANALSMAGCQVRYVGALGWPSLHHFNAGYIVGRLLGLEPQKCLPLAIAPPSLYLRSGSSPTLDELRSFFADENSDTLANAFSQEAGLLGDRGLSLQLNHASQL